MAEMSDYLEYALANHVLRNTTYTPVSTVYLALFTNTVTNAKLEAGSIVDEVSGASYIRKAIAFATPNASTGVILNATTVEFPTAPVSWGTITHYALMDASTSGNVLIYGTLDNSKTVDPDDIVRLNTNALSVTWA